MQSRIQEVKSSKNKKLKISVINGHFATNHSHVNRYLDLTEIRTNIKMAKNAAETLADEYKDVLPVNTIVCMEGTEILAGYLAQEIAKPNTHAINSGADVWVVTPELDSNRQMFFRDNLQNKIWNKQVLILVSSITTGKAINRALECISYYGGEVVGVAAVFSAKDEFNGYKVNSIFTKKDIPEYESFSTGECPQCKNKVKIDAIVNSYGYSKI